MNVLVTGGAGFIGAHLIRFLLERTECERITAFDNLFRGSWDALELQGRDARLEMVAGDIRDPRQVGRAAKGVDTVFHLAAQSRVMGAERDVEYAFQANVAGAFNVLRAVADAGAGKVVFSSSREVYGEPTAIPVPETAPFAPKNAYGASKMAAEAWCGSFAAQGLDVSILRLSNIYGPGDSGRVIPIFLDNVRKGLPLAIYGGEQTIDFLPVATVCRAMWSAALTNAPEPINVGSGTGTTLQELAKRIHSLFDMGGEGVENMPGRPVETKRFVADVSRMRDVLGVM
ncbi:MAG: NAD-dependent epimerase/dehydratase family protein [Thermodesulfobacteriota bacterium]|nr:NAD-dependent epimerase/dehydratase family protein [Thermodesulfobacteriota bacterium]